MHFVLRAAAAICATQVPSLHSLILGGLPQAAVVTRRGGAQQGGGGGNNRRNEEKVRRTVYISDIDPQVSSCATRVGHGSSHRGCIRLHKLRGGHGHLTAPALLCCPTL